MPELPEVETYRKYLEEALYDASISTLHVERKKVLKTDLEILKEKLIGKRFVGTRRIGKYLFLEIENQGWLLFHFGMTGKVEFYADDELRPKFSRFIIEFSNGMKLAFINMRLFGKVEWVESLEAYQKENNLGVDALEISRADFIDYVKGRKSPIKSVLLHQQAFAGVGNWIADELLFQARIHPKINCRDLTLEQLELIYKEMIKVLKISVEKEADYHRFPDHFMVQHRWGDGNCPLCGEKMTKIRVGGRGTFYCEKEQNL